MAVLPGESPVNLPSPAEIARGKRAPAPDDFFIEVRPLQRQDIPAIAETVIVSFHDTNRWWSFFWNSLLGLGVREDLHAHLQSGDRDRICLVAVARCPAARSEIVVGTVELSLRRDWLRSPSVSTYISNLAVRPHYRRRGVARRLLQASDRVARNWATGNLSLHVMEDNRAARELYKANGYHLHRVEMDWGLLWGTPRRLLLRKVL